MFGFKEFCMEGVRGRGVGSALDEHSCWSVVCLLNICCCSFVDVGLKSFVWDVFAEGDLGALAMSTRVGELCVVEGFLL